MGRADRRGQHRRLDQQQFGQIGWGRAGACSSFRAEQYLAYLDPRA